MTDFDSLVESPPVEFSSVFYEPRGVSIEASGGSSRGRHGHTAPRPAERYGETEVGMGALGSVSFGTPPGVDFGRTSVKSGKSSSTEASTLKLSNETHVTLQPCDDGHGQRLYWQCEKAKIDKPGYCGAEQGQPVRVVILKASLSKGQFAFGGAACVGECISRAAQFARVGSVRQAARIACADELGGIGAQPLRLLRAGLQQADATSRHHREQRVRAFVTQREAWIGGDGLSRPPLGVSRPDAGGKVAVSVPCGYSFKPHFQMR